MKDKIAVLIATWFHSGSISFILPGGVPGTCGGTYASLFAIPLCYAAMLFADIGTIFSYWAIVLLIFVLGLWSVPRAEISLGPMMDWKGKIRSCDQNQIGIDEVFGMLIACYPLVLFRPESFFWGFLSAFLLFRLFDVVKVPPTNLFDRMKSAAGVMLDDFMAGVYAALALFFLISTIGF